jgi:deoxyribonuclease-4
MTQLLGAHMSTAGGVHKALQRAVPLGCTTIQIFSKNNMQWFAKPLGKDEVARFDLLRKQTRIGPVFSHAGYLINLGATNPGVYEKSLRALVDELQRAEALGLPFVVLHPGSHMGRGEEAGLKQIASALDQVFAERRERACPAPVRIALEITAGQGNCLGNRFAHLARIYDLVAHPDRLAVCLDTCHLFAAGYDIRTQRGYARTMSELDRVIGTKQVVAIHVNDSKTPLGSRVDRHTHIGKGQLGLAAFRFVMNDPRFKRVPKVLETPKEPEIDGVSKMDRVNLAVLRKLVRKIRDAD